MTRHPNRRALQNWMAGSRNDLTRHVDSCERCLGLLDELTVLDGDARHLLAQVVSPEPGFPERVRQAVERRAENAETWSVAADLFSLGWRVWDVLVDDGDG